MLFPKMNFMNDSDEGKHMRHWPGSKELLRPTQGAYTSSMEFLTNSLNNCPQHIIALLSKPPSSPKVICQAIQELLFEKQKIKFRNYSHSYPEPGHYCRTGNPCSFPGKICERWLKTSQLKSKFGSILLLLGNLQPSFYEQEPDIQLWSFP